MLKELSFEVAVTAGKEGGQEDCEFGKLVVHHMLLSGLDLLLHLDSVLLHFPFDLLILLILPLSLLLILELLLVLPELPLDPLDLFLLLQCLSLDLMLRLTYLLHV